MRLLVNSYGKTWRCRHTGRHDGAGPPADSLPFGEPMLMWSFNRDGEADPRLRTDFASAIGIDEAEQRARRRDLAALAHPQHGVDALQDRFPGAAGRPEGVRDTDETGK